MTLDWSVVWDNRDRLLEGAGVTIILTVSTMVTALPAGLLLALLRLSPVAVVRGVATGFVEFFRATPLILQIYWVFYVLPAAFDISFSDFTTALVGLSLNVSAFNSETFRAGIQSIRPGQRNAALALGMSSRQAMLKIVLPQAAIRVLPSLASTWVSLFKDTSLVSIIAVGDLSYEALKIRSETYRVMEVLTAMAGLYFMMGYPQAKLVDWLHRKLKVRE
jgi:polar amino acid transport system permease protein